MNPRPEPTQHHKRRRALASAGLSLIALCIAAAWYLTSPQFNERVRGMVIAKLEQATGGKVELQKVQWKLSRLQLQGWELTVHGKEAAGQAPYIHMDHFVVRLEILSLFEGKLELRYFSADHPEIHILVYPNGSTNQPVPEIESSNQAQSSNQTSAQELYNLAVRRMVLNNGEIRWNNQRFPFVLTADDVSAKLFYVRHTRRFGGLLKIGKLDGKFRDFRPVASSFETQFSLGPTDAQVKALHWKSGDSQLQASGSVQDFRIPRIQADYDLALDLRQAGVISRMPELRAGQLRIKGAGTWSLQQFATDGKIFLKNALYDSSTFRIPEVSAEAQFAADNNHLALTHLTGSGSGGTLQGDAEIKNWMSAGSSSKPASHRNLASHVSTETGVARLHFESLQVAKLAAAISNKKLPLNRLKLVGVTSGTAEATWSGSPHNIKVMIAADVSPPAQVPPNTLPVKGIFRGTYFATNKRLEITQANFTTRATTVTAAGEIGSNRSQLQLNIKTSDLGEFRPLLTTMPFQPIPVDLHGSAVFSGTVSGKLTSPMLNGHFDITDFSSLLVMQPGSSSVKTAKLKPASPTPLYSSANVHPMHWDRLSIDLQISPTSLQARNGVLARGSTKLHFQGSAALHDYRLRAADPFNAHVDVSNAAISDVQQLAGTNYSLTGTLNFSAQITGSENDPRGTGSFQLANGTIYNQPFRSLHGDLRFAQHEAQLQNVALVLNGASIRGSGAYNLSSTAIHFDIQGTGFDLAHLRKLNTNKFTVQGQGSFHALIAGTLSAPVVNANLNLRNLVLSGEPLGDLDAQAVTQGADLQLKARSHFRTAQLVLDGSVRLLDGWPANIAIQFSRVDIDPLLRAYIPGRITNHSSVTGDIRMQGSLRNLRAVNAQGELQQAQIEVENVKLASEGPVRFAVASDVFTLQQLRVVGDGTDFSAHGSIPLSGSKNMDVLADGRVNLHVLQSFDPALVSYGMATLAINIGGTLQRPILNGRLEIANAGISYVDLPNGLSHINGTLVFNENHLQIESLTAQTGGGALQLGGTIAYANGISFDLTANGKDIRLRYPPGVSAVADANLKLAGNLKSSLLSGDITVIRFGLNPNFDFAQYLASSAQPLVTPSPDSPLNGVRLDLNIVSTPGLQVQTSLAKLSGDAELRVRGTAAHPSVLGRVNIIEGDLSFKGTKYHLDRGDILFVNPLHIEPILNIDASARVRGVDITVGLHGPIDKLSTTYRSDPPLPTSDIISLLAGLGGSRQESTLNPQPQQNATAPATNALLSQALNATISSRAQRLFGVSRIAIGPPIESANRLPASNLNASVTVEQQVSNRVTVTYITNLTQSSQQIIQVEIQLTKNISLVGVRDEFGVVGFDVRIRQRKR